MNRDGYKYNKRWYDEDPTLSLAVSFIRNASPAQQQEVAERIMQKTTELGVKVSEVKIVLQRRWFDENETLSNAMEHLKLISPENQKLIALDIINYLTEIKA